MQNSSASPNIILVGFPGTGKTAIGREVARLHGWGFVDNDVEIVRRTGRPIEAIFAQDGEPAFRRMEREVLAEACARQGVVIATGGGAMVDPANRELLRRSGRGGLPGSKPGDHSCPPVCPAGRVGAG